MTPTTLMATAVLAEAWQSHLEEEAGGDHECVPEYCGEDVLRLARALPSDRRAALAAELLDVETLAAAILSLAHGKCCWEPHEDAADIRAALRSLT